MSSCSKKYRFTFSGKIDSISGNAIANTAVTSVELPNGLQSMTSDAFEGSTNMAEVFIGKDGFPRLSQDNKIYVNVNGNEVTLVL